MTDKRSKPTRSRPKSAPPPVAGRVPPHDLDAEAAVLSAMLLSPQAVALVLSILRPEHFYSDANGHVFEAIRELALTGTPVDIVSVAAFLRDRQRLARVGGAAYLAQLADATPAVAHVLDHARLVVGRWRLRQVIATCQKVAAEGYGDVGPIQDFLDGARDAIGEIAAARTDGRRPARALGLASEEAVDSMFLRAAGDETPIATPWPGVNRAMRGGFWPGLYTLSSASGTGKTQWAIQCATAAARAFAAAGSGDRVRYIALELGESDLVARVLGELARERWSDLLYGSAGAKRIAAAVERSKDELQTLPFDIDAPDALGWTYRDLARIGDGPRPPKLVVLDYAQLVGAPPEVRAELRETIGNVAKVARDLARRRGIAVLALSSTARSNYGTVAGTGPGPDGEKPRLGPPHDPARLIALGKESGELEFTADVVIALAREPETAEQAAARLLGEARKVWLALAKGRGFAAAWAPLLWDGCRFTEPDEGAQAHGPSNGGATRPLLDPQPSEQDDAWEKLP